jgi:hypothetical protein
MILGADNQNKNLAKNASKRIDTSARTKTSNSYSAKIASSKNDSSTRRSDQSNAEVSSRRSNAEGSPDPVKGSYEGLIKQSAGHIQMDGDGYDNPSFQTARYKEKTPMAALSRESIASKLSNSSSSFRKNDIITNYSSAFNGDNVGNKMRDYLDTEKFFR